MNELGGDNKMQNSPAEIYANVRNRALDEAAALFDNSEDDWAADLIRALKSSHPLADGDLATQRSIHDASKVAA